MQITDILGVLFRRVAGRMIRRAIAGLLCLVFALAALYQLTVAATFALELKFGTVATRLAVGGVFAVITIGIAIALFATRAKLATRREPELANSSRDLQIAMIVESILLGLALARGTSPRKKPSPPPEDSPPS